MYRSSSVPGIHSERPPGRTQGPDRRDPSESDPIGETVVTLWPGPCGGTVLRYSWPGRGHGS
eukprot:768579-Hanusia_phi.AAC.3